LRFLSRDPVAVFTKYGLTGNYRKALGIRYVRKRKKKK